MPTILFMSPDDKPERWHDALAEKLPGVDFRVWSADEATDKTGDPADIDYAMVWAPHPGVLASLPNLKAVLSLGAEVDHLISDPELPANVPVVRLVDRCLTQGMSKYIIY